MKRGIKSDLFLKCLISALIKRNRYGKRINRIRKSIIINLMKKKGRTAAMDRWNTALPWNTSIAI